MVSEAQGNDYPPNTYTFEYIATLNENFPYLTAEEDARLNIEFSKAVEEVFLKFGIEMKVWKEHPGELMDLTPTMPPSLSEL